MSQNGWGWQVIESKPLLEVESLQVSCPGLCPDSFWISAGMELPQSHWAACDITIVSDMYWVLY